MAVRIPMTEEQFMRQVRETALLRGWVCYHTRDSRGSDSGFPDLVLVNRRQVRLIFAELKTEIGRVTLDQQGWLSVLSAAGCEAAVWRPADLLDIEAILRGATHIPTGRSAEEFR